MEDNPIFNIYPQKRKPQRPIISPPDMEVQNLKKILLASAQTLDARPPFRPPRKNRIKSFLQKNILQCNPNLNTHSTKKEF
jgi:hypothetical protein